MMYMTNNLSKQQHIVEKNMKETTESLTNESENKEELCENNESVNLEPNISYECIKIKEEDINLEPELDTFYDEQYSITEQSPSGLVEFVEIQVVKTEIKDEYDKEEDPIKITEVTEADVKRECFPDEADETEPSDSVSDDQGTFTCNYCKRAFTTSEHCQKHIRSCRDRVYNQPSTSATSIPDKKPRLTNEGEKPYHCDKCDNKYKFQKGLYLHLRRHSGVELHICTECHKQFSLRSKLARHLLIHTGRKPHKCTQCEAAFNTASHLKTHMLTHSGARPHTCSQCGQSFTQSCNLTKHMRTHTGERPYQCTQCNKAFTDASNLTKHMRIHTGEKPYQCTVCNKAFVHNISLKNHMKTHSN